MIEDGSLQRSTNANNFNERYEIDFSCKDTFLVTVLVQNSFSHLGF